MYRFPVSYLVSVYSGHYIDVYRFGLQLTTTVTRAIRFCWFHVVGGSICVAIQIIITKIDASVSFGVGVGLGLGANQYIVLG